MDSDFMAPARLTGVIAASALIANLAGCAATTLDGSWMRPEFAGKRIDGPVLVVGVTRDETMRRIYEDRMVARLAARGVKATQSYESVGELESDAHERLAAAARKAGARYLLSTAVIGQNRELVVTQEPMWWGGAYGYRSWYGYYWGMAYPVRTDVRAYAVYVSQTSLTDLNADRIEWVVRTRSTDFSSIERDVRDFVDVIVETMVKAGLVAAGG
jgi:hypothetical protein